MRLKAGQPKTFLSIFGTAEQCITICPREPISRKSKPLRKKLTRELTDAIRINLGEHVEETAAATEIVKIQAKADDPSIWASAGKTLTHNDAFRGGRSQTVALAEGPRSYIRIIPAAWVHGAPSIRDIGSL